ncbi:MAG: Flp pilus assembly protein CpaB [Bacillota bacterium]
MEKTNKKIIIIALIMSLITAALVYIYVSNNTSAKEAPVIEYAEVYVAARTIPAGTEITKEDVKQVKVAKELANANAAADMADIAGKRAKESIIEGEQFMIERLSDGKDMSMSFSIPDGMRAVSMNVNEQIGAAYLLRPGDYVDIVASFEQEEESQADADKHYPRITRVILQNVQVLAIGQDTDVPPGKLTELPATVTLAVKKEDVEKFVYASEYGILRIALRPADDKSVISSQGVMRADVTGDKGVYIEQHDNDGGSGN